MMYTATFTGILREQHTIMVNYLMPYGNLYKTEQSPVDEQKFRNVTNVVQQTTVNIVVTQLLFQLNALVFIKSTRHYNLYFLSLYS
jgi:hypothetical protein